jgi:(p)ppGpp synthase/HD superfamily hydrolase
MSEHGIEHKRSQKLIDHAYAVAKKAHEGQERKYTGEPYITHPVAVANICAMVTDDVDIICGALLHDTIEDCETSVEELTAAGLGWGIIDVVVGMTDISKPEDGNRATRKAKDREFLARQRQQVHTVKLADVLHNGKDISENDPRFAKVYMREISLLVPFLSKGNIILHEAAVHMLEEYWSGEHRNFQRKLDFLEPKN